MEDGIALAAIQRPGIVTDQLRSKRLATLARLAFSASTIIGLSLLPNRTLAQSAPTINGFGTNASCTTSGSTVDCESFFPNLQNLTLVSVLNGQSTSNPINYTLLGHPYGVGPSLSGYGTVLGYFGYGQVPTDTYPSELYVQGPDVTVNDEADVYSYSAYGFPVGYGLQTGGVLLGVSFGSHGFQDNAAHVDVGNFDGAPGGTITIDMSGIIIGDGSGNNFAEIGQYLDPTLSGIGAFSFGGQGVSNKTGDTDYAGGGGNGGQIDVDNAGDIQMSNVSAATDVPTYGIYAVSEGGEGSSYTNYAFGKSGDGGSVSVTSNGAITDAAPVGIGIKAESIGGVSDDTQVHNNDDANDAGNGGTVNVTLDNGSTISMAGSGNSNDIGVEALSAGGNSGGVNDPTGGAVKVTLNAGSAIQTVGTNLSIGVLAISSGSIGAVQPDAEYIDATASPGSPGAVTVSNAGTITTSGSMAVGIAGLSIGGSSIVTSQPPGGGVLGNTDSYDGIEANTVNITNSGGIRTDGGAAFGIAAISVGGGGGLLNGVNGAGKADVGSQTGGSGGGESSGAAVTVDNTGTVITGDGDGGGKVAIGIVAQSVGGGGGSSSAKSDLVGGADDSGKGGGNGGTVTVDSSGTGGVLTYDDGAIGVLAQSIGGGGGDGANVGGVFVAVGGQGGNGGNGGGVNINLGGNGVTTLGDFSAGVIAQSVGGGGGNGGFGTSGGLFVDAAIGGGGGSGGSGGNIDFENSTILATAGQDSVGLVAQSIGGGGGNGGAATSITIGSLLTASIAMGGTGGQGGIGGSVTLDNNYHIITSGPDAVGIIAQSIGGGGGTAGASTAKSVGIGVPDFPDITFTASLGASGGGGGSAGNVTINNAGETITKGDGAYGVLAQSIGGGGGNGGDSTAGSTAIEDSGVTAQFSLALGGSGGIAGSGGAVIVTDGSSTDCNGCLSQIYTGGDDAGGIIAQSIGGGGGTSTAGEASTGAPNLGGTTGDAFSGSFSLGASGGAGGYGGTVTVTSDAGNLISTTGSGSPGITAQSIGGGGGDAGGGSSGGSENKVSINLAVGGNAGNGIEGGPVTVTNAGTIITTSGDSIGILAQSIGGGGGTAGSTDASASITATGQAEDIINVPSGASDSANLAIGGKGGSGANGSAVTINNTGTISTLGERAYGIEAQSIGAGGGNGGAATSTSNGSTNDTFSASLTVGGAGGGSGGGDMVDVASGGAISTAGYNADGIMAQSIGGGGGVAGDGSVTANTTTGLGAGFDNNGGSGGSGYHVNVATNIGGDIATFGDDAVGILAQSIGGGGGTATSGCTNSLSPGLLSEKATDCFGNTALDANTNGPAQFFPHADFALNVGGSDGANGNGGTVTINVADAIVTAGARAMGVVAQSIGGGGGFAEAAAQNISGTSLASDPGISTGGAVTVTLTGSGSIITLGAGAWGVFAQSIGGSGGFDGDPSLLMVTPESNVLGPVGGGNAYGNNVNIVADGNIITSGKSADGIVAQSIGGGGGIVAGCCNSPSSYALAGDNAQFRGETNSISGSGSQVNITQGAGSVIQTSGLYSTAILAQSSGNDAGNGQNPVTIKIGGTVIGGTAGGTPLPANSVGGADIYVSGGLSEGGNFNGTANSGSGTANNPIDIEAGGSVGTMDGIYGNAIVTIDNITVLTNDGIVTGNVDFGASSASDSTVYSIMTNNGIFNTGPVVVAQSLTNNGTLNVAGAGNISETSLTGNFVQNAGGTLAVDVDSLAPQQADLLTVSGSAQIAGIVAPGGLAALLPGISTVVNAGSLNLTANALQPLLFTWTLAQQGNSLTVMPQQNFRNPRGATASLTKDQSSLAGYLATAWNNGDPSLAATFASLSQIPVGGGSAFVAALVARSPRATQLETTALKDSESSVLGSSMSCPMFEGQTIVLGEGSCIWTKVGGEDINQYASDGEEGFHTSGATYRLGGQKEFLPGWFLGGSLGATTTWSTMDSSSSQGQTYDGSVAIKHEMGDWLFAGSFGIATGSYRNDRIADLPGGDIGLQSDSNALMVGGRLRAAYDIPFGDWYVRPIADVDVLNIGSPSFRESGPATYALDVRSSDSTNVMISPIVEFGGRFDPDRGTLTLRYYADFGVSFMPGNSRTVDASFAGALPTDGSFATTINSPTVLGDIDIGVQLYQAHGLEVKADYGTQIGSSFFSQGGALRLAYHF